MYNLTWQRPISINLINFDQQKGRAALEDHNKKVEMKRGPKKAE